MKSFSVKIFLFALFFASVFLIINTLYILIIAKTDFDFRRRIETLQFDNPKFDLLVLGASTTLDGIDTKFLSEHGIPSYNMAIGGSTVRTNYIQLKEYLKKYSLNPHCVILGLNSKMVKTFDDPRIHPIVEITMKEHEYNIKDLPLLKLRWLGLELFKKIVSKNHRNAKMIHGQVKFQGFSTDNTDFTSCDLAISRFENSYWIGQLASLCNQYHIKLIILEMPGFKKAQNNSDIGPYSLNFNNRSSAILYNFASKDFCSIFNKDRDWIGNSHLNENGATKFTNKIITLFEEN
jgi:hypothetical protein